MAHPKGGLGNKFSTTCDFDRARMIIGDGIKFQSSTKEIIIAKPGLSKDGYETIIFIGERTRHGNVCKACWGYRLNCSGTRIGHCVEGLDKAIG